MTEPVHAEFVAESITKIVLYVIMGAVALYFGFRKKKDTPPR
jgi:choline-glycine betaine transporter